MDPSEVELEPKRPWFLSHKVLTSAIVILLLVVIIGIVDYAKLTKDTEQNLEEMTQTNTIPEKGSIEGSLSYPSHGIPDMQICAENIQTKVSYCTEEHITDSKYQYGVGYKLDLPTGEFVVYASLLEIWGEITAEYKAYYSESSLCGHVEGCGSNEPLVVKVISGETQSDINPDDWYR